MRCHICKKEIGIGEEAVRISFGQIKTRAPWGRSIQRVFFSEDNEYLCKSCAIKHNLICE